ncbi:malonate decarboxylase-specific holo-ACP synthase [Acidocella sp. MX-AZ02]|nr:malonate decarboxylase-specific holo-ACP synthase [Acidocella sp. MX-AZ02]
MLALATQYGIVPACFGGLAWQHLTGLAYLSPSSDLDTLWPLNTADMAPGLAADLAQAARGRPAAGWRIALPRWHGRELA